MSRGTVCVTGGTSGLGEDFRRALYEAGYGPVVSVARRTDEAHDISCDLSDIAATQEALASDVGALLENSTVLINNAAFEDDTGLFDFDPFEMDQIYRLVVIAPLLLARHFLRAHSPSRPGRILNIGSVAALRARAPVGLGYKLAKTLTPRLTALMAAEAGASAAVNALLPGPFESPLQQIDSDSATGRQLLAATPAGRFARTSDIVAVAMKMLEYPFVVTGTCVTVDGGLSI